jgi:hypothetical protein
MADVGVDEVVAFDGLFFCRDQSFSHSSSSFRFDPTLEGTHHLKLNSATVTSSSSSL